MKARGPGFVGKAALAAGLSVLLALLAYGLHEAAAAGTVIPTGTVMVGTGTGLYTEYTQNGTLITQLDTTSGSMNEAGCAFDPLTGDFYGTSFQANSVSKFDATGAFLTIFGSGYNMHPESIVFDSAASESVYVGQADGTHEILKFDTSGKPTGSFTPVVESRGTDWIDIASDRCTVFYTSEGADVKRFNVCTKTQLTNFNTVPLPGSAAFAHRILLPGQFGAGGVLVGDAELIVRLDSTGKDVQHYAIPDASQLFALSLDPDGTSFWTGDLSSGFVTKVNIKSGTILQHWLATGAPGFAAVGGVCLKGELVSVPTPTPKGATPTPSPKTTTPTPTATPSKSSALITAPAVISVTGAPGQTVAAGTFTLTNTSSLTETFTTITLGLSNQALFSSLKLDATFDASSSTGTSSVPLTSTVITMSPPIVLTAGAKANFTLTATLSSARTIATGSTGSGLVDVALLAPGVIGVSGERVLAVSLSLLMLGLAALPGSRKRRVSAALGLLVFVGTTQTSCDPCGSCPIRAETPTPIVTPTPFMSTITVTAAGGTDSTGATVVVNGVPAALSKITRIGTATPTPKATPTPAKSGVPTATATAAPNACLPSSSIGVLVQTSNVTAYVPKGNWRGGPVGVNVVPVETSGGIGTGGPPTSITTASTVNSCSCNSATGQTVCVANNTDVYLITASTLKSTLTSGATGFQGFSGGDCQNCGVVVDSSTNKALITVGLTGSTGGFQFLDLAPTPTFETPIPAGGFTSEDASIDPNRKLVLSPNESGNYQILNTSSSPVALFNNNLSGLTGAPDSAGEDCTTGIALSTLEGSGDLFIADLTQAKFTSGSPGTWTDTASQIQHFPEFVPFSAGTNGIAIAPGTQLGIVTGEFGGNLEGVIQLPATSGSGTPAVKDWVVFTVPKDPSGVTWTQGFDPHTVTAYVSPNSHKALSVLANSNFSFLAVVDLDGLLKATRTGAHTVDPTLDLVKLGLVTFIAQ